MSDLSADVGKFVLNGLYDQTATDERTFKGWLSEGDFKFTDYQNQKSFEIEYFRENLIKHAIVFETSKLSTSAFESINGIRKEVKFPKTIGWLIIRSYYSAYYSVHAIMRCLGHVFSQLDSKEALKLKEILALYFPEEEKNISTGFYSITLSKDSSKMNFRMLSNSHKDVWSIFYEELDRLSESVSESKIIPKEKRTNIINILFRLRQLLSNQGSVHNGAWLSQVRNNVNYRHSYGAWFPYVNSKSDSSDSLFNNLEKWKNPFTELLLSTSEDKDDLNNFIEAVVLINSLCKGLIKFMSSNKENKLIQMMPVRYLKLAKAF
jgi:hypothetical protein